MINAHVLIYEENLWNFDGVYFNSEEELFRISGKIETHHETSEWITVTTLEFQAENQNKILIKNRFKPSDKAAAGMQLSIEHSELGIILGRLMISEDHLIVVSESEDKKFSCTEYMKRINPNFYKNRGIIFAEKENIPRGHTT